MDDRAADRALIGWGRMPPALADLTTLRLGGPAGRLVEAADEAAIVAARARRRRGRRAAARSSPAAPTSWSPTRASPAPCSGSLSRGVREDGDRADGRGRRAVGPVRRALRRPRAAPGVECLAGHPRLGRRDADPERRRLRPGGRRDDRRRCGSTTARDGAVRELAPDDCGFSYRSSVFKRDARALGRARGDVPRCRADRARAPIRYAELARALGDRGGRRPRRSPRCARRCSRCAARKGMVIDPADPDSVSAGSFFTNPVLDRRRRSRRCRPAPARASATAPACRASPQPDGASRRPPRG